MSFCRSESLKEKIIYIFMYEIHYFLYLFSGWSQKIQVAARTLQLGLRTPTSLSHLILTPAKYWKKEIEWVRIEKERKYKLNRLCPQIVFTTLKHCFVCGGLDSRAEQSRSDDIWTEVSAAGRHCYRQAFWTSA